MRTLIADDDAITRMLLNSTLTKLGHEVHEAGDGMEALKEWSSGEFSFVISDWLMPRLDGLDLCRGIRAEQREDYTYIVLLTSNSGKANHLEAMNAGADDFISKPFERDVVLSRVRVAERILGLHASLRAANTGLERRVFERTTELHKAIQARAEFFSHASHELHTPMNHILGFAQLLQMDELTIDQAASVAEILNSGNHLLHLIDQMLCVSEASRDEFGILPPPDSSIEGVAFFDHLI
jgi:DNA-binding response OmpR family regulator